MRLPFPRPWTYPLSAQWRDLVLISWRADDAALTPLLPHGLELDRWHGDAYVSLVGMRFARVRLFGVPAPPFAYDEINLRFYVRRKVANGDPMPGVVFIRQIVPHRMTALAAQMIYGEPFVRSPISRIDEAGRLGYRWRQGGIRNEFAVHPAETVDYAEPDSLEDFLTTRHWGYNGKPTGPTTTYHVQRPAWKVGVARPLSMDCDLEPLAGGAIAKITGGEPTSALFAGGSRAAVGLPRRIPDV